MDGSTPPPWADVFANIQKEQEKPEPNWIHIWRQLMPAVRVSVEGWDTWKNCPTTFFFTFHTIC